MNVLACYKVVYEDQDITVNADQTLSFDRAELRISLYDLNAIEEAVRVASTAGGSAKCLCIGDARVENSKIKKNVLSRGINELFLVSDPALSDADTNQTAKTLAAAAKKVGFDLIICGEGSGDLYAQQTGVQLGEILGVPVLNAVSKLSVDNGCVIAERMLEDMVEVLKIPLPAVICVTSDINEPRIPGMKDILNAGKKPSTEWNLNDVGITAPSATMETMSVLAPKQADRKRVIFDCEDQVAALFEKIKNDIR